MKVVVDTTQCEGFAVCTLAVPEVFELDEAANQARVRVAPVPDELLELVEDAVGDCPTHALSLVEHAGSTPAGDASPSSSAPRARESP